MSIMAWAGQFNEKIEVWKLDRVPNGFGETVVVETHVRDTRAKVTHLSGSRTIRNEEIMYPYSKQFIVRIFEDIDEDMLIVWKGKKYRILSIDTDRERQWKNILTEIVNE